MYRPTWTMEAYLNGEWVDITADVLGVTRAEWGISGDGPTDFVADTGELSFDLQNYNPVGKYSPGHANCTAGWGKGVAIRQTFTYKDYTKRVRRYVESFQNAGGKDERKRITAVDWMEYASLNPIKNPGILENMRGDEVLTETLALMPIPPQSTDFDTGINTFPTAFDTVTSKTKAINEFVKVALSEIGRVYLVNDSTYGETLVFENAQARNGLRTLTEFSGYNSGYLKKADGAYLLKSDGGKIKITQRPTITLHLDNDDSVLDYEIEDGENVLNRFTAYAVPRRVDTSAVILFKLDAPIPIASGQTITIRGTYANPDGGLPVNANPDDMISPVATTDYRAWTNDDGTGTEITLSLTVTPSYGTEGFVHTVYNGSINSGYVTLFNCRGYGIYTYNPIEHQASDTDSQDANGIISDSITQKYKNDLAYGTLYVDMVVDDEKDPRTVVKRVYLNANKDETLLFAFLQLEVGDVIHITEDKSGVDSYYFIQAVAYETRPGGIVMFNWIVKPFLCLALGMSALGIEFRGSGTTDGVNFGVIPHAFSNNTGNLVSISAWINVDTLPSTVSYNILSFSTNNGGFRVYLSTTSGEIGIYSNVFNVSPGIWQTASANITTGTWKNIVVTFDLSSPTNDPIIYVNSVLTTTTETITPLGSAFSRDSVPIIIGNVKTQSEDYNRPFDGKIKDVRVYNRILSAAEITTLYNGGTPDMDLVTDGLQFQAFVVPTFRLTDFVDATLTSDMKVRDRIHGVVGTPHGSPIGRNP